MFPILKLGFIACLDGWKKAVICSKDPDALALLAPIISLKGKHLICPFYHGVADIQPPYTRHVYRMPTLKQFALDLEILLRHYRPLSLADLLSHWERGIPLPYNAFHLSFDDGLTCCYERIRPLLLQKGIPATFFINSAFIDNKALFYRYKASLLLEHLQHTSLSPSLQKQLETLLATTPMNFSKALLGVGYPQSSRFDQVATILGVDFDRFLQDTRPYLTLSQLQALHQEGFTLGGHSVDHPYFAALSPNAQVKQALDSVQFLQSQFNLSYQVFAFPFTDHGVLQAVFHQLYESGLQVSFGTAGLKEDMFSRHIQRIPMEKWPYQAKGILYKAYMTYFPKRLLGKHRVAHPSTAQIS